MMLKGRRALMTGPDGTRRQAYIEIRKADGIVSILDTGVNVTSNMVVRCSFRIVGGVTGRGIFGTSGEDDPVNHYRLMFLNGLAIFDCGSREARISAAYDYMDGWRSIEIGTRYIKDLDSGALLVSGTPSAFNLGRTLVIGSHSTASAGRADTSYEDIQITAVEIATPAGEFVRDYAPAEVGGTWGLRDSVTGSFTASLTSTQFTGGFVR